MSFKYLQEIPTADEIKDELPLASELNKLKERRDQEIRDVITGQDDRFLLVIGPCSADDEAPILEYGERLARLQERVKERLIIVPRIYTNKPRTTGAGYKGMLHQPKANRAPDVVEGIKALRRLHLKAMARTGLPAADEMLYPENYPFVEDLLSYVAIGARSVENQLHRLTVSGLEVPVGMKNPTSGDLGVMLNSIQAAQLGHQFIYNRWQVETTGNPWAHAVLRGAVDQYGRSIPNFHYEDIIEAGALYAKRGLANPALLIDTNHANSNKQYRDQIRIAKEVMTNRQGSNEIKKLVKGLMIESYLIEGSQSPDKHPLVSGQSVTDPCLGWEDSERLVLEIATMV